MTKLEKHNIVAGVRSIFSVQLNQLKAENAKLQLENLDMRGRLTYHESINKVYQNELSDIKESLQKIIDLATTGMTEDSFRSLRQIQKVALETIKNH